MTAGRRLWKFASDVGEVVVVLLLGAGLFSAVTTLIAAGLALSEVFGPLIWLLQHVGVIS